MLTELRRWAGREPRRVLLISLLLAALLLLFTGACQILQTEESVTCTPEMKAFFDEFPQHDGGQWRPTSTGRYCGIRIGTSGSEEEIFTYYLEKLRENGWEVTILKFPDFSGPSDAESHTLIGRQEGQEGIYYYEVNYEPLGYSKRSSAESFIRVDVTLRRR